ncbi:MAG: hypothetical protein NTW75_01045, partial [Planctomycetales bacterium]|nr:hypothetical protein [Planctomycetales bacterium]
MRLDNVRPIHLPVADSRYPSRGFFHASQFRPSLPLAVPNGLISSAKLPIPLAARGERQLLEFESAMDRQLRRVWVSVVSNELFAVETAEMLERRTN